MLNPQSVGCHYACCLIREVRFAKQPQGKHAGARDRCQNTMIELASCTPPDQNACDDHIISSHAGQPQGERCRRWRPGRRHRLWKAPGCAWAWAPLSQPDSRILLQGLWAEADGQSAQAAPIKEPEDGYLHSWPVSTCTGRELCNSITMAQALNVHGKDIHMPWVSHCSWRSGGAMLSIR